MRAVAKQHRKSDENLTNVYRTSMVHRSNICRTFIEYRSTIVDDQSSTESQPLNNQAPATTANSDLKCPPESHRNLDSDHGRMTTRLVLKQGAWANTFKFLLRNNCLDNGRHAFSCSISTASPAMASSRRGRKCDALPGVATVCPSSGTTVA